MVSSNLVGRCCFDAMRRILTNCFVKVNENLRHSETREPEKLYFRSGCHGTWIVGRSAVRPENAMAVERRVPFRNRAGHPRLRPLPAIPRGQFRLPGVPAVRLRELQRHAQPRGVGCPGRDGLADPQEIPMDSRFMGPSHPVRHSAARNLILPDTLALASSNTSGQWPALGSTQGHDSELRGSHRRVRILDGSAISARANRTSRQNYWDR